jgi:hypothetical protein
LLEVILKSGNFPNRPLARRNQVWLVRGMFDKLAAGVLDPSFPIHGGGSAQEWAS